MSMVRMNITLPAELGNALKHVKNKSVFITEAIRERLEKEQREQFTLELQEGYTATLEEDRELVQEWDSTSGDGLA